MNLVVLSQVRETIEAVVGNRNDFSTCSDGSPFKIGTNNVKNRSFRELRMAGHRARKQLTMGDHSNSEELDGTYFGRYTFIMWYCLIRLVLPLTASLAKGTRILLGKATISP